ncbi:MAG: hypothetical protein HY084_05055 [Gemmatimonadetes bacterium]|nr:hypothetical protein [Gemmatimonadota bacterium]
MSPVPSVANVVAQIIIHANVAVDADADAELVAKRTDVARALRQLGFATHSIDASLADALQSGLVRPLKSGKELLAITTR